MSKKQSTSVDPPASMQAESALDSKSPLDRSGRMKSTGSSRAKRQSTGRRAAQVGNTEIATSAAPPMPAVHPTGVLPEQPSKMVVPKLLEGAVATISQQVTVREKIALLAYSYWEARGRQGGSPDDDWYRAEREVLGSLETGGQ